jgi:hypothetical protein
MLPLHVSVSHSPLHILLLILLRSTDFDLCWASTLTSERSPTHHLADLFGGGGTEVCYAKDTPARLGATAPPAKHLIRHIST